MLIGYRAILFVVLVVSATLGPMYGQRFGRFFIRQNAPPPDSEFVFARWQYSSGSGGWSHDYPDAEEHINQIMKEATGIHLEHTSYSIVPMSSEEIFNYPFGYISEPGMMWLTEEEVRNFRRIGDFWEWIDQPQYALKPSAEGLKLGINFVVYAMTH
jgi:hypothetical protein